MQKQYNPAEIEKKWQQIWDETGAFKAEDDFTKPKFYPLIEFPYPSGAGLHVGHPRSNTAMDIIARMRRMQGYNVLFPIGWDAFGLPTEKFAIKMHEQHAKITITSGLSGYSCSSIRPASPTRPKCPSTGAQAASAAWPMRKW